MEIVDKMDIRGILERLPHRYPFLLVDRVLQLEPNKFIHAYKNVTANEPHFTGHFPDYPVMPGVLIIEALAQAAGILTITSLNETKDSGSLFYFAGINDARFKKPVMPGDQLHLYIDVIRYVRGIGKYKAVAKVDDEIVAEAELMCAKRELI